LDYEEDDVLNVKDKGRSPVSGVIDVTLNSGANYEMVMLHTHVHHSLSEVKVVVHFLQTVVYYYLVLLVESHLDMCPGYLSVYYVPKHYMSISTSSCHSCPIVTPR
jgi:hypothetical protein